jgi:SAM-dependent methyltransferase
LERYVEQTQPRPVAVIESAWDKAAKFEAEWWGLKPGPHWSNEVDKQTIYQQYMRMPVDLDFGDKVILDVGCGPCSILLRAKHGGGVGVDPLPMSEGICQEYTAKNIRLSHCKAENFHPTRTVDEAWCYNCLEHVENPQAILRMMADCASTIRIFEWLETPLRPGHINMLTEQTFLEVFGDLSRWKREAWDVGEIKNGLTDGKYIALCLTRRTPNCPT